MTDTTHPISPARDFEIRGILAARLKCWYRLTGDEAQDLVHFFDAKAVKAEPTAQQAHDMGAKGATPTEAERLLFEAWMRGHCWAVTGDWDGKQYVHPHEKNGYVVPSAMSTRSLWAAWRDRAALCAPQPAAEPLTDAQAMDLLPTNTSMSRTDALLWVLRATERHHKIGAKP